MNFFLILKGFIIGIGKIIPGVSGSLLAISLGIYENIIYSITHFFDNLKENSKLLISLSIGIFLAIIFFSKLILFCLTNYYYETMYLFLGLIIGTLINFIKKLKITKKNIFIFLITLFLIFFLFKKENITFQFNKTIIDYIYIIILGLIDALTSIIPGISGTAIFMILGVYEFILNILSNPFQLIFILYLLGVILGIITTSYLMNYLLTNKKEGTYMFIFALIIFSILTLFLKIIISFNLYCLLILSLGIIIGYLFDK